MNKAERIEKGWISTIFGLVLLVVGYMVGSEGAKLAKLWIVIIYSILILVTIMATFIIKKSRQKREEKRVNWLFIGSMFGWSLVLLIIGVLNFKSLWLIIPIVAATIIGLILDILKDKRKNEKEKNINI